jgi:ABC-type multidrug transport system fused ATPase/permease subunit
MGLFDKTNMGNLLTRLSSDAACLNGAILIAITTIIQTTVTLLFGLGYSFAIDYRTTLIIVSFLPFLIFFGIFNYWIRIGLVKIDEETESLATSLISHSINGSKIIHNFNAQNRINEIYKEIYSSNKIKSIYKQSLLIGFLLGLAQFGAYAAYATVFYAGGNFILQKTMTFSTMMSAIFPCLFSGIGVAQAQVWIGDYSKTKGAVNEVFSILNTQTKINPLKDKIENANLPQNQHF